MLSQRFTRQRVVLASVAVVLYIAIFPTPTHMADFMIGCSVGNFRASSTCQSVCRLLQNRTACCYGVNYDSRAVCACCNINLNSGGKCPTVCNGQCHIITLNAGNCSELRGIKSRAGNSAGPSIINDLSILSDHPQGTRYKNVMTSSSNGLRSDVPEDEEDEVSIGNASAIVPPGLAPPPKTKSSFSSTTNKLFSRLSSALDIMRDS